MEVLIIQKEVLEEMAAKFNCFTERVGALLAKLDGKSLNGWMDNQEVCRQLNISPRTLQTLRDNGRKDSLQGIEHRADACRQLSGGIQIAS